MSTLIGYSAIKLELTKRLREQPPGRVQVLTGPRQVGKTTLLLDVANQFGTSGIYLAVDAPEASLAGWWEIQWLNAVRSARTQKIVLFLDEVHYLSDWSRQVKSAIDQIYRERLDMHIVVSGSAALELGFGTRETMAGRFERLVLGHWRPWDIAQVFGLSQEEAVDYFIRFGSFPGGIRLRSDIPRWQSYIRDSIIEPAIGRDLMMLKAIQKPALLRQIFAVCAGHPAQVLSLNKIAGSITDTGTLETLSHYLHLLQDAFLVASVQKYSSKQIRRRASSPKLIPLNNAFLAAFLNEEPPTQQSNPQLWGQWLENACLSFMINSGQSVFYWREEPREVDAVITGSWGKWAIEIKSGSFISRDLAGMMEFCRRNPDFQPLVLCGDTFFDIPRNLGIEHRAWKDFFWNGLSR